MATEKMLGSGRTVTDAGVNLHQDICKELFI